MLVDVEVADFVDAARTMYSDVADPLLAAAERLVDRLGDTAAMAGSDPAGTSWASSYDRAARAAVAAEQNAINGCYRLSAMFAQSARNYENADTCSDARARHSMATETAALPDDTQVSLGSSLPASAGGSGSTPFGWWLIAPIISLGWPDGHQDRLRAAAAAWTASAEAIDAHSGWAAIAAITFVARPVPESDDVHRICNAMTDHLRSLARAHRSLASACNELAHHLDALHHEAIQEIESLLEWTAAIEGAGALASAVTLGAAEGPTQDVETARVGLTAARIAELISDFIGLAVDAAAGLPVVEELAASITIRMEELFGSRLAAAGLTAARGLPAAIRTTRATRLEMAAERDIASGAERVIPTISKQTSPIWRGLKPVRGSSIRTNGLRGSTKRYYAWDHTHEDIEVFDHNRRHLGSMDAKTGVMTKDAVKGRKIDGH